MPGVSNCLTRAARCCGRNWVAFDKISAQIREAPFRERGPESAHSVRQGFQTDGRRYQRSCSANARCRLLGPPMPGRGHRGEKQCEFIPGAISTDRPIANQKGLSRMSMDDFEGLEPMATGEPVEGTWAIRGFNRSCSRRTCTECLSLGEPSPFQIVQDPHRRVVPTGMRPLWARPRPHLRACPAQATE
jgi:hypothetical protein